MLLRPIGDPGCVYYCLALARAPGAVLLLLHMVWMSVSNEGAAWIVPGTTLGWIFCVWGPFGVVVIGRCCSARCVVCTA